MKRLVYSPLVVAAGTAGLVLVSSATALAFWVVRGDDSSHVTLAATELPAGGQPVGSVDGRTVTLRWRATEVGPNTTVGGYRLTRYGNGGSSTDVCGGSTVTATECVDLEVPAGTWTYTVRPEQGTHWAGAESPHSDPVAVAATPPAGADQAGRPTTPSTGATTDGTAAAGTEEGPAGPTGPQAEVSPSASAAESVRSARLAKPSASPSPRRSKPAHQPTVRNPPEPAAPTLVAATVDGTTLAGGRTVALDFDSAPNPAWVIAGWDGAAPRTVSLLVGPGATDQLTVVDGGRPLAHLGTIALDHGGYVTGPTVFTATLTITGSRVALTIQ